MPPQLKPHISFSTTAPLAEPAIMSSERHKTLSSSSTSSALSTMSASTSSSVLKRKKKSSSSSSQKAERRLSSENKWYKSRYHLVATNSTSRLPSDPDDPDSDNDYLYALLSSRKLRQRGSVYRKAMSLEEAELYETKIDLLKELGRTGGDVNSPVFRDTLDQLTTLYSLGEWDAREDPALSRSYHGDDGLSPPKNDDDLGPALEGTWLTLSKPNFAGCIGKNQHGEYAYTLGGMSFDMFRPTDLVVSIQGTYNQVEVIRDERVREGMEDLPKGLRMEVKKGLSILRTYNIITAFTIEPSTSKLVRNNPDSPNRSVTSPIKGVMTTKGYVLPDPQFPHRLSVWFNGGTIEVNDDFDLDVWSSLLGEANSAKSETKNAKRRISGKAKIFAAKMLMGATPPEEMGGMEEDGKVSFRLKKPIGGHGKAFVDVLYLDDTMRIVRGHRGTDYVFVRVPED